MPRYRRASSCAAPDLYGILEVPDGAGAVLDYGDGGYFTIPAGVWSLYLNE